MKSVLQKIEVINPDGSVASEHGPYVNAITDTWIDNLCSNGQIYLQNNVNISSYNPSPLWYLSTGKWFPIKYRHTSPGTVSGRVLVSPGLKDSYGDPSGLFGYVNSPSLTGKVIKFDSGEEYYISGVNASGEIILRSGERIITAREYLDGNVSNVNYNWYYPDLKGDKPTPEYFTVWDLGRNNYAHGGSISSLDFYGPNYLEIKNSPTVSQPYSKTFAGSATGDIGVYSGVAKLSRTLDSPTLASNIVLGKFSNNLLLLNSLNCPVSHVNIDPPVTGLAGQILRISYDMYVDMGNGQGYSTSALGDSPTPIISGWPTSSGYFVFFKGMNPSINSITHDDTAGGYGLTCRTQLPLPGVNDAYHAFFGQSLSQNTFSIRPIIGNGINLLVDSTTNKIIPSGALTPTGRSVAWNTPARLDILNGNNNYAADTSMVVRQDASRTICYFKEYLHKTFAAHIPISIWNTTTLSGFCTYNNSNGASQWAFMFHEPQTKLETHDLYFSITTSGIKRTLEN